MVEPAAPPPPSPGHWHAMPARPVRAGLRLLLPLAGVLLLIAVVLALALAGLRWLLAGEDGSRWLLGHLPFVEVRGFTGALLGPRWHADRVDVRWNGGRNELLIEDVGVDGLSWQPRSGIGDWVAVDIASLSARRVQWTSAPSPPSTTPISLPQRIAPPLRLHLARARIDELSIDGQPVDDLQIDDLSLDPSAQGLHRIGRFAAQGFGVAIDGSAQIANRAPLDVSARVGVRPTRQDPQPVWGATLQIDGPLQRLQLTGTLRGVARSNRAPPTLDLRALLRPLNPWPLESLALQTSALDLSSISDRLPGTRLTGEVTLGGGDGGAPLVATVQLRNDEPGRWNERRLPLQQLALRAERSAAQPARLDLSHFELAFADASRQGGRWSGSAVWQGSTLTLRSRLDAVAPQRLDGRAAAMTLAGPIDLTLHGLPSPDGSAAAGAPSVDWRLALDGRLDAKPQPVHLELEGHADDARLELRHLQAHSGQADASLTATLSRVGRDDWQVQSQGQVRDFDPLPWWPGSEGSIWRRGPHHFSGDWQFGFRVPGNAAALPTLALAQRLVGNGRLRVHDSVLAGVPVSGTVTLGYTRAAAPVPGSLDAVLEIGGNRVAVEGRGDPAGSGADDRWRVDIKAEALAALAPLSRLSPALADWVPHQGRITGQLAADGRWPSLHTEGNLQLSQLEIGSLGLSRGSAAWAMNLTGERPLALQIDLAGVRLGARRADHLHARLHGTVADHHIELSGAVPVLPPAIAVQMLGIEAQSGTEAQLQAQGSWVADPAGGGRWRAHIERLIVGSWDGGIVNTPPASDWVRTQDLRAELQFDASGQLVTLQASPGALQLSDTASLRWQAVSLDLRDKTFRGELHADIEPFPLAPLLARAQPDVGWQGDLRLAAKIDIRAADKVDADLVFERRDGDLHIASDAGLQLLGLTDLRVNLSAHDGLWHLQETFRGRSLGEITGDVQARTSPDRRWPPADAPLQGRLQAHVADLGIWGSWVPPGWRLVGELKTTAQVGGTIGAPQYRGDIEGSGIGVRDLLQGVNVHDGSLSVELDGDRATVSRFTLQGGDGTLEVTGGATLGSAPQAKLAIKADRFRVLGRVDRQAVVSGLANLQLDAERTQLDGQFTLDEGLYDAGHSDAPTLDDDVTVRRPGDRADRDAPSAAPPARRNFVLDVTVDLGQKMHVRGHGLDTELRGQVRLTTPGGRLAVNGTIRTEGGTYVAYGQNLEVERGIVAFSGAPDNPRLDVLALRPNLDVRVGVQIVGNLQTPRVRLYSDPAMADSDKLSWLLLGRAPDNLGRNDTAMLQQAAVALLSGEGEAPTDALLHNLGIDQLTLRQSDTDVRETVVSLGKQLSRNWYLGYERGVNATTGTWQLIYRLAQRFTLRLQSGLDNSADVIWTWRFQEPPSEAGMRKSSVVPP